MTSAPVGELCSTLKQTQTPAMLSDEYVWHFSIPAFDQDGKPELVRPITVGSNKLVLSKPCVLFSRLNPRIPRVWDLTTLPRDHMSLASTEFVPFVIEDDDRLDGRYLFWFLQSRVFVAQARAGVRAATKSRERVQKEVLFKIQMPLPPLAEQRRIAAILDKADVIRRKRRESIELLEEFLRSAFLEMFGDPVRNPKGWPIVPLRDCLSERPRIGTIASAMNEGRYRVIRVGELGNYDVALGKSKTVTLSEHDRKRFEARPGDLLLARAIGSAAHLGKASLLQEVDEVVVFDSHVMRLRADASRLRSAFLWYWLQTSGGRARFLKRAGRTAVQFNINAKQVGEVSMAVPPIENQDEFVSLAVTARGTVASMETAARMHSDLFNSLAQRAFRGQLQV